MCLPFEVLGFVFGVLPRKDLTRAILASRDFHDIGVRILYRNIVDLSPPKMVLFLKALQRNGLYIDECMNDWTRTPNVRRIRQFTLVWGSSSCLPTANLYRLLWWTLKGATALTSLSLELPGLQHLSVSANDAVSSPCWILDDTTFRLNTFMTSLSRDAALASFLCRQTHIKSLVLRGLTPFSREPQESDLIQSPLTPGGSVLPPNALPHLTQFRVVHASPALLKQVVSGRPITDIAIPIFNADGLVALDALLLSTAPLRKLMIMSFDMIAAVYLLREIAARFPMISALHIVGLVSPSSHEPLRESAILLSPFKILRSLTFIASSLEMSTQEENEVATEWHKACPSLRTIVLPKGRMWCLKQGKWAHSEFD